MISSRIGLCVTAVSGYFLIDQTVHLWIEDPGRRPVVLFLLALGAFLLAAVYMIVTVTQARAEERIELRIALLQADSIQAETAAASAHDANVRAFSPRPLTPRVE
ncbi:MAG: hypothetical protein HOV94_41190 [Saccharothrix sp.]|nr:hypothetical protein [Saccharothrix sp.]